ncbi:5-methylcytosine-specific restriction endonuclease McrA [Agrococcus sp. UYP33]
MRFTYGKVIGVEHLLAPAANAVQLSARALAPATSASILTAILVALALAAVIALILWAVSARVRAQVESASTALQELNQLNSRFGHAVAHHPPLEFHFVDRVNSKSKFDGFDLEAFMLRCVLEREAILEAGIATRRHVLEQYLEYERAYWRVGSLLGRSAHQGVRQSRFDAVEARLYKQRRLLRPTPTARVRSTVKYTSPQGKNAYARSFEWGFDALHAGLRHAQQQRASQSTAQYLRQRERAAMNSRMRMDILRRDQFRCRMCGASASEGATLHVDHKLPVSRGGLTVPENLQALCQTCNLGKSNHFVG